MTGHSRSLIGLAGDVLRSHLHAPRLPYRVQLIATYRCNFRCEMCGIWQRQRQGELTPDEVARFFARWPGFHWVNLSGGEIFMRPDIDQIVRAVQETCRSLFMINFPTTGWFGDRTVALAGQILERGIGRLMITISIDGPREVHEQLRGLPGCWDRAVETYRRLRAIRRRNFQAVVGMTLLSKNVHLVEATIAAIRQAIPDFAPAELHLNVCHRSPHYLANSGYEGASSHASTRAALAAHRRAAGRPWHPVAFIEDRYQTLATHYLETGRSPLPCAALSTNCFIDPYWDLYPCSIWNEKIGNLRDAGFDLAGLLASERARSLRREIVAGSCPHCWTPCEAYPTILASLPRALAVRSAPGR